MLISLLSPIKPQVLEVGHTTDRRISIEVNGLSELSVISWGSTVERCLLSGVPLYLCLALTTECYDKAFLAMAALNARFCEYLGMQFRHAILFE